MGANILDRFEEDGQTCKCKRRGICYSWTEERGFDLLESLCVSSSVFLLLYLAVCARMCVCVCVCVWEGLYAHL